MKSRGYAVTYAGEACKYNQENYFLNGICKEDIESLGCYTINKDYRSRNFYAVSSAVNSEIAGVDLAYIAVDVLKSFFGLDFEQSNNEYFTIANNAITSHVFESGSANFDVDSSVVYIADDKATVYNIGDTPVFFFEKGSLEKVSGKVPHTVKVQKSSYDDYGILQVETVERSTAKHLGAMDDEQEIVPYVSKTITLKNDCDFIICSSAVEGVLGANVIKEIMSDSGIKEEDKATRIIDRAVKKNPDGNYTVLVVAVRRGTAISIAEKKSLQKWIAVAVACVLFCFCGEPIATGIGNFIKGVQSVINYYSLDDDDEPNVPLYVPKNKTEEKQQSEQGKETDVAQDKQPQSVESNKNQSANIQPQNKPQTTQPAPQGPKPIETVDEQQETEKPDGQAENTEKPESKDKNELPIDFD